MFLESGIVTVYLWTLKIYSSHVNSTSNLDINPWCWMIWHTIVEVKIQHIVEENVNRWDWTASLDCLYKEDLNFLRIGSGGKSCKHELKFKKIIGIFYSNFKWAPPWKIRSWFNGVVTFFRKMNQIYESIVKSVVLYLRVWNRFLFVFLVEKLTCLCKTF